MSTAINAALSCDGNTEIQMNSGLNLRPLGGYQKGKQSISKKVVTLTVKEQPAEKEKEERTRKKTRKLGHYKAPKARSVSRLPETQNATRNQKRNEDNMSKEKWAKLRPVIRFGHTFLKMLDHTITAKRKLKRCMRAVLITVRLRRGLKEHLSHSEIKQLEYLYKCSVDQGVNLSKATEIRLFLAANKCCMQEQELQLLLSRVRFEEDKEAISMDSLIELLAYRKWQRRMEQGREQSAVLEMLTNLSENDIREWLQTVTSIGVRIDVGIANKSDTLNKLLLLSGAASSESNRSSAKNGSTKQQSTTVYNESPQQNTAIDQEVILLDGTVNIEAITVRLRCTHQRHVDDISLLKRRLQFLDKLKNTPAETDGIKLRWNMLRDVAQDGVIRSVAVPRLGGSVSSRKESQRFSNELTKSKIIPQSGTGIKAQSAGGGAKVRIPYHFSLGEKTHRHRRTSDSSKSSFAILMLVRQATRRWLSVRLGEEVFLQMDTNRDGVCTMGEVTDFLQRHPTVSTAVMTSVSEKRSKGTSVRKPKIKPELSIKFAAGISKGKTSDSNDDAFFISKDTNTSGVADGVSGWKKFGIDPSAYSNEFLRQAKRFLESADHGKSCNPRQVLESAFELTRQPGSAVVCLAAIRGNVLQIASVGDSTCLLLRNREVLVRTSPQLHAGCRPYQLALQCGETPADCDTISYPARPGDIVILATDGITNNISERSLIEIISSIKYDSDSDSDEATAITAALVETAYQNSLLPDGHTDDITAVAMIVG